MFQDTDSIQPGKKWRREIAKGLAESQQVVVFWCDHARSSDEVTKEWTTALELDKDLLPLLLDATPLPPALNEYQWIDFQEIIGSTHANPRREKTSDELPSLTLMGYRLRLPIRSLGAYLVHGTGATIAWLLALSLKESVPIFWFTILLLSVGVLGVLYGISYVNRLYTTWNTLPDDLVQRIVHKIETEIIRRADLKQDSEVQLSISTGTMEQPERMLSQDDY